MKYDFIQSHSSIFAVKKMCEVFKVSRSGYYHYIHRDISNRAIENSKIVEKIKFINKQCFGVYGSPRIYEVLKDNGFSYQKPLLALKEAYLIQKNILKTSLLLRLVSALKRITTYLVVKYLYM